ncbi:MAG: carboxypeptidase regulatory-like domain-containing protein [Gemmatimonadaceae bacterium]
MAIAPLHAQDAPARLAAIAGVVRDTLGHPLRMATVFVEGKDLSAVSDDSGRFYIARIPAGRNLVTALRIGYKAVSFEINLPPDTTLVTEIHLRVVPTLGRVTVTGERVSPRLAREGFYTRLRQGWGSFLTPEKVEQLQALSTPAKMLRDVKGLEVRCPSAARRCAVNALPPHPCLSVFVNGSYLPGQLDDILSSSEVYAVEVYNTTIPMEFQTAGRGAGCAAVVVWTVSHSAP